MAFYWFMAWELCFRLSYGLDMLLQFCIFVLSSFFLIWVSSFISFMPKAKPVSLTTFLSSFLSPVQFFLSILYVYVCTFLKGQHLGNDEMNSLLA